MIGEFRFYQDGELLLAKKNLITTAGKALIQRYLAGQSPTLVEAIGLGVSAVAANIADTRLGLEVVRIPVDVKVADLTAQQLVFKGTLPQTDVYNIYEAGGWSASSDAIAVEFSSRIITVFDTATETWTNITADTTNNRATGQAATVTAGSNATVSTRNQSTLDLSGYSGSDVFVFGFYKANNNVAGVTLAFENTGTGGSYKSVEQNVAALPTGYNIVTISKGAMVQSGTISWDTINQFGFDVRAGASGGSISLDALRIEDTDTVNPSYSLVSHSVLGTPLNKTSIAPMDIEYALGLTFT